MTRVDVGIKPTCLSDQHLTSNVREITRPINNVLKYYKNNTLELKLKNIPTKFKLGSGHVRFFYDKIVYLRKRYFELQEEYQKRYGKLFNEELYRYISTNDFLKQYPTYVLNDYKEDNDAIVIVKERIITRLKSMKNIHYNKQSVDVNIAIKVLRDEL
jgi:deoxyribonuclease (pyrimidine dimer)